jgi:hypothetical protein
MGAAAGAGGGAFPFPRPAQADTEKAARVRTAITASFGIATPFFELAKGIAIAKPTISSKRDYPHQPSYSFELQSRRSNTFGAGREISP